MDTELAESVALTKDNQEEFITLLKYEVNRLVLQDLMPETQRPGKPGKCQGAHHLLRCHLHGDRFPAYATRQDTDNALENLRRRHRRRI